MARLKVRIRKRATAKLRAVKINNSKRKEMAKHKARMASSKMQRLRVSRRRRQMRQLIRSLQLPNEMLERA